MPVLKSSASAIMLKQIHHMLFNRQHWRNVLQATIAPALALAVFANGAHIFIGLWRDTHSLHSLFDVDSTAIQQVAQVADGPWLLLSICLMLNGVALLFRARVAWIIGLLLMTVALIATTQFYDARQPIVVFRAFTLLALFVCYKQFRTASAAAGGIFSIISFILLLLYSSYGSLYYGEGFKPAINSLLTAFYFSIVTMTTVGYGDIIPVTDTARLFTASMILAGITVFATAVTTIFGPMLMNGFSHWMGGGKMTMERKNHYVVCGASVFAISMVMQLKQRGLNVTLVTNKPEEYFAAIQQKIGAKLDIISGDSTDNAVLEGAGVGHCHAIIAMTNDDASNAFITLTAREVNPDVRTVVVVNDASNIKKIRQVKASVLLSPQLFGSEILASVLAGESLDHDTLTAMLESSGHGLFG